MLGHKLWQTFRDRFDTYVTFRQSAASYAGHVIFDQSRALGGVSAQDFDSVVSALSRVRPEVVVNCIGIVKQDAAAKDALASISINALFPHRLARLCQATGVRLLHLSTDCVFSGRRGSYEEVDAADAEDLYGRSKLLGEVAAENCLTIRTSMIGRELAGAHGLLEWFLSQRGQSVRGFRRAIFSGFTTLALSEIIASIINDHAQLQGVWHVAAEPISKFDLLTLIKETADLEIEIEPDESFVCDRSLNDERFRRATGFVPPSWSAMISQLFQDTTPYAQIRRSHC
jgi:dTDP-4-dehydrorhamnose reductase